MATQNAKDLLDLFNRLQLNLVLSSDKIDACLEAVEKSQIKCMDKPCTLDGECLQSLRSTLAAVHMPTSALRNDLLLFMELFRKRFMELEEELSAYKQSSCNLLHEMKLLDEKNTKFVSEKVKHEESISQWKKEVYEMKRELAEQSGRLALLSSELAETKLKHEKGNQDLVNRRIAFEEEIHENTGTMKPFSGEEESLRKSLREQALKNIQLENLLLQTEVKWHKSDEYVKMLEKTKKRLTLEVEKLRTAASSAIKLVEAKTLEANEKLSAVGQELSKARSNMDQFKRLFATETEKHNAVKIMLNNFVKSDNPNLKAESLVNGNYLQSLSDTLQCGSTTGRTMTKFGDITRKHEIILLENATLKATMKKLRNENVDLMKCLKHANSNSSCLRNQVLTSLHERGELMKKLNHMDHKFCELQLLLSKRNNPQINRVHKKKEISAIPVFGSNRRTWISTNK